MRSLLHIEQRHGRQKTRRRYWQSAEKIPDYRRSGMDADCRYRVGNRLYYFRDRSVGGIDSGAMAAGTLPRLPSAGNRIPCGRSRLIDYRRVCRQYAGTQDSGGVGFAFGAYPGGEIHLFQRKKSIRVLIFRQQPLV